MARTQNRTIRRLAFRALRKWDGQHDSDLARNLADALHSPFFRQLIEADAALGVQQRAEDTAIAADMAATRRG